MPQPMNHKSLKRLEAIARDVDRQMAKLRRVMDEGKRRRSSK